MAFNWDDYLRLAKKLAQARPVTVCVQRTAISRAYYSILHQCADFAVANGHDPWKKGDGLHSAVPAWFSLQNGNVAHQQIAKKLHRMRKARVLCDYSKDDIDDLEDQLILCLSYADEIKELL